MTDKRKSGKELQQSRREKALEKELRANLSRRKNQARARSAPAALPPKHPDESTRLR